MGNLKNKIFYFYLVIWEVKKTNAHLEKFLRELDIQSGFINFLDFLDSGINFNSFHI